MCPCTVLLHNRIKYTIYKENRFVGTTAQHLKESFFICYEIASLSGEFQDGMLSKREAP